LLAVPFGLLAFVAAHLYYQDEGAVWPLCLTFAAIALLGLAARAAERPTTRDGNASRGDIALGVSVIVLIATVLLAIPPESRVEQPPSNFMSLAAMDAKIDRFLKTRKTDPSVLANASFGGFEPGSEVLDCKSEEARRGLNSILDAIERAHGRNQRPVLVLVGMTDRMPLNKTLQRRYESSSGLASARADAVEKCLGAVSDNARRLVEATEIVRLTTGPSYTPQHRESASSAAAAMAQDRHVNALLISVPVGPTAKASAPAQPPGGQAQRRVAQLRVDLGSTTRGRGPMLVIGLLGIAALIWTYLLWRGNQGNPVVPEKEPEEAVPAAQLGEALTHVRDMHAMFAELRTKNFNFFIVVIAATIAGAAGVTEKTNLTLQFISSLAAAVTCIIFFGIEKRTVEMLGDARQELERLEPLVGVRLSRRDKWVDGTRRRHVTHTRLYLAAFVIAYFGAIVSIFLHYPL